MTSLPEGTDGDTQFEIVVDGPDGGEVGLLTALDGGNQSIFRHYLLL